MMYALIDKDRRNRERIRPFIGGEEVNNDPLHAHRRYVIQFDDLTKREAQEGWPDLLALVEQYVRPQRLLDNREQRRENWWQHGERQTGLYNSIHGMRRVIGLSIVSPQFAITTLPVGIVYAHSLAIFAFDKFQSFAALQSRVHESWTRFFSSSMKDDLRYAPSDCFRTFPFPANFEIDPVLEAAGEAYHAFRAQLMIDRNVGLTKTYNRFHARGANAADIATLRTLHHAMDVAVLRAYGWDDLADAAAPEFIEQDTDEGRTPKTRLDWSASFKDKVLARLLSLNAQRAAEERAAGLVVVDEGEDNEEDSTDD